MKKIYDKYYIQLNLIFILTIVLVITLTFFYFLLPILMNYDPDTVGTSFQREVENTNYTSQIITIGVGIFILYVITVFLTTRFFINIKEKLYNVHLLSNEKILLIKNKLFEVPYSLYVWNIILPTITIALIHTLTVMAFTVKTLKLVLILFSFVTLSSTICLVITRRLFTNILAKLPELEDEKYTKTTLSVRIYYHIIPLLIVGILFTAFVGYSRLTLERGNAIFDFYKQELIHNIQNNNIYNYNDLINNAKNIKLESPSDFVFISNAENKYINLNNQEVNFTKFFKLYMEKLASKNDGKVYDDYGRDSQAVIQYITINDQLYIVGVYYNILSASTILFFIIILIILLLLTFFILTLFANTLSSDLKRISDGMLNLVDGENVDLNKKLSLISNDEIGDLTIAFNKIQEITKNNIAQIHANQDILIEKERLASLGQMIGGIAHNLKTPIMSISGAAEGLSDLIKEYESSVGDPEVTVEDHHEIAHDMAEWIRKTRVHLAYMSDIITAIKGQAVAFSEQDEDEFTIEELVKYINVLMKHELANALITLNTHIDTPPDTKVKGNINSLVQVINNIISNSIQAYNGKQNEHIELSFYEENKKLIIKIEDRAGGLPDMVKQKLFKEMITTKGKNRHRSRAVYVIFQY